MSDLADGVIASIRDVQESPNEKTSFSENVRAVVSTIPVSDQMVFTAGAIGLMAGPVPGLVSGLLVALPKIKQDLNRYPLETINMSPEQVVEDPQPHIIKPLPVDAKGRSLDKGRVSGAIIAAFLIAGTAIVMATSNYNNSSLKKEGNFSKTKTEAIHSP